MKKIFLFLLSLSFIALLGVGRVYAADGNMVSDTKTMYRNDSSLWVPALEAWQHLNWPDPATTPELLGAKWIWNSNPTRLPSTGEIVEFKRDFIIVGEPTTGVLHITADNEFSVYLNGSLLGSGDYWGTVYEFHSIVDDLLPGENLIEISATNLSGSSDPESNPAGLIYKLTYEYDPVVLETPTQTGYNVNDRTSADEPRDPNMKACTGSFTNINGVSVHWTDEAEGDPLVKYQRQYSTGGSWSGNEIYTTPFTNYRKFGGGLGTEGTYYSRVRSFYDFNSNGIVDSWEPVSGWSNVCDITYDITAPVITLGSPVVGGTYWELLDLQATCSETCDYVNFWWRADDEGFSNQSPDKRYHYVRDDGTIFSWTLDTLNAERSGGDSPYEMYEGLHYFYAAGKDLAGNWARTEFVPAYIKRRAAAIVKPEEDEIVFRDLYLEAYLIDNEEDYIDWAVRQGTCDAGRNTVLGNVDESTDSLVMSDAGDPDFKYTYTQYFDVSGFEGGMYCFIFHPRADSGEDDLRLTREFYIAEEAIYGGGQIIKESDSKPKDDLKISFGGHIWDVGDYYLGDWEVNFHNVGIDTLDKAKFHTNNISVVNYFLPTSVTCTDAINFTAYGRLNNKDGYKLIFRAGDYLSPGQFINDKSFDTVRIQLYEGSIPMYDTHSEFDNESTCVGTARTGLDHGNITISY